MADPIEQIDTSIEIVTPENIAFRYHVAGPFRRLLAWSIDLLIRVLAGGIVGFAVGLASAAIGGIPDVLLFALFVFLFVLYWFYCPLFETYWNGQTPGKRLMQLRVLSFNGEPINGLQATLRNILGVVDFLPGTWLVGLIAMSMNDRFQRLGDLVCGTIVVIEEQRWFHGVIRVHDPGAIQLAGEIPANFEVSLAMARSLASYVQRRAYFPVARRYQIARHLGEPLRERFGLPPWTNLDHLLCGLYHRTFITDQKEEPKSRSRRRVETQSPFVRFEDLQPAATVDSAERMAANQPNRGV